MRNRQLVDINKIRLVSNIRQVNEDDESIKELARSISSVGLINPVSVIEVSPGEYQLIAGHQRYLACKSLGLSMIEVSIFPVTTQIELVQFAENHFRKDMLPMEKARSLNAMLENGMTQAEISRSLSVSTSYISLSLSTLKLPKKLQDAIDDGVLSPSSVEPLFPLEYDEVESLIPAVLKARSVRKVASVVNAYKKSKATRDEVAEDNEEKNPMDAYVSAELDRMAEIAKGLGNLEFNDEHKRTARKIRDFITFLIGDGK